MNAAARSASAGERLFAASSGAQSQPPRQRRWVVGRRAGHRRRAAAVVGYLRYKACKSLCRVPLSLAKMAAGSCEH